MARKEQIEKVILSQNDYYRYFIDKENTKEDAKEMRAYLTNLVTIANKRIKRLNNAMAKGTIEFSGAFDYLHNQSVNRFSVKGKSQEEMKKLYIQVSHFLNMRSSTVTESKKMETESYKHFNEFVVKNNVIDGNYSKYKLTKKEYNQYRRIQEEMRNVFPDRFIKGSPVEMMDKIITTIKNNKSQSMDELMAKIQQVYQDEYKQRITESGFTLLK